MLINIPTQDAALEVANIANKAYDDEEFLLLLSIYKEDGYDAVCKACSSTQFDRDDMLAFIGKEALLITGWVEILTCIPIANSERFVATFSDNPSEAHILDSRGYNSNKRIYKIRDKEKQTPVVVAKAKRGRPRKDTSFCSKPEDNMQHSKSLKDLIKTAQSDLMTEPDFPFYPKD